MITQPLCPSWMGLFGHSQFQFEGPVGSGQEETLREQKSENKLEEELGSLGPRGSTYQQRWFYLSSLALDHLLEEQAPGTVTGERRARGEAGG